MTQPMKETRSSLWYIKQLLYKIAREFNSVRLMSIQVIESQNAFY